jgi:hypothetical protein
MAKKHTNLGHKHEGHPGGCVTSHEYSYVEGNTCSHRWQASLRARKEKDIAYIGVEGEAQPFRNAKDPWPNNAHHVLPRAVLAGMVMEVAEAAKPRVDETRALVVTSLLKEKYNLNDQKNMIILPLCEPHCEAMRLPSHLCGGHFHYSNAVAGRVRQTVTPEYDDLVDDMIAMKHVKDVKPPEVASLLEQISKDTYKSIVLKSAAARDGGATKVTLDSLAPVLY